MTLDQVSAALQLNGITKSFAHNTVLTDVSLTVRPGEVVGLLGENGAGKSTLIKILNGVHAPDRGSIMLGGEERSFSSPTQAIAVGMATVHQESSLVPTLDIEANLLLGQERYSGGSIFLLRHARLRERAREILSESGFELNPRTLASDLSVGERQMVEIARALAFASTVLILDEPTAALSVREAEQLFALIRRASAKGLAVILVTHRLDEVPVICDRVVVLRDGRVAGEISGDDATQERLIGMMLGREISAMYPAKRKFEVTDSLVLETRGLATKYLTPTSIEVRAGEIVGLTGLMGAGQREFVRSIYGVVATTGGTAQIDGRTIPRGAPSRAVALGIAYVSGDRGAEGVMPNLTVEDSLVLPELRRLRTPLVFRRRMRVVAERLRIKFRIGTTDVGTNITELSGGNQQKVLIARWLVEPPKLLILDDPTLGVDVGSKSEIYELIAQLAAQGTAVLLVSSESQEILGLSDRVLVFRGNALVANLSEHLLTESEILRHALGAEDRNGKKGAA